MLVIFAKADSAIEDFIPCMSVLRFLCLFVFHSLYVCNLSVIVLQSL